MSVYDVDPTTEVNGTLRGLGEETPLEKRDEVVAKIAEECPGLLIKKENYWEMKRGADGQEGRLIIFPRGGRAYLVSGGAEMAGEKYSIGNEEINFNELDSKYPADVWVSPGDKRMDGFRGAKVVGGGLIGGTRLTIDAERFSLFGTSLRGEKAIMPDNNTNHTVIQYIMRRELQRRAGERNDK